MTLEKFILDLKDESRPLKHAALVRLSSLTGEEFGDFRTEWISFTETRRFQIIEKLVDLVEDNIEVDCSILFRMGLADTSDSVREYAVKGLWETDDRVIIRPLINMIKKDPSSKVRIATATLLLKFSELAQQGKLLSRDEERIRNVLLEIVGDEEEEIDVRRRAIEALGCFSSEEIEGILQEAYDSDSLRMKQSAIYAMGRSSDDRWLPFLISDMKDEDASIRYEAVNACGYLGDENLVPSIIDMTEDEDVQVQVAAVQALGNIGGSLAKQALMRTLNTGDQSLEEAAEEALSTIDFDDDPLGFRFQI